MIIHHLLLHSHLQYNAFLFCCILVLLLYYSVVTHMYIIPCALPIIQAQSYNTYHYLLLVTLLLMADQAPTLAQP